MKHIITLRLCDFAGKLSVICLTISVAAASLPIQDIVSSAGEELDEGAVRVLVAMLVRLDLATIVM